MLSKNLLKIIKKSIKNFFIIEYCIKIKFNTLKKRLFLAFLNFYLPNTCFKIDVVCSTGFDLIADSFDAIILNNPSIALSVT